jgi:hypothetical protein
LRFFFAIRVFAHPKRTEVLETISWGIGPIDK